MSQSADHPASFSPEPLLPTINGPADVKNLPVEALPQLAQEIRDEIIDVTSNKGGHVGPNLGVVELCIGLHRVFESPKDQTSHWARRRVLFQPAANRGSERISLPRGEQTRLIRRGPRRHRIERCSRHGDRA